MAKLKLYAIVLLLLSGIAGGMVALWHNNDYSRAARDLPRQLREARAEGLPLEPADLPRKPPIDPANNAAATIRDLAREAEARKMDVWVLDRLTAPNVDWSKETPAATRASGACRRLFDLAREAAAKPDCDFELPVPMARGDQAVFISATGGVEALAGMAGLEAHAGRLAVAWQNLEAAAVISRHLGTPAQLLPLLTQQLADTEVTDAVGRLLIAESGSPSSIARAKRVLNALGRPPDLRSMLRAELVVQRMAVRTFRTSADSPDRYNLPRGPLGIQSPFARTATACEAYDARLIAAFREVDRSFAEHRGWDHVSELFLPYRNPRKARPSDAFVTTGLGLMSNVARAVVEDVARRRLCVAAIGVYAAKNREGVFPQSLPEIGEDGIDPFVSKPFVYKKARGSFILYSVGVNRRDDGGGVSPGVVSDDIPFGLPWQQTGQTRILHR